MKTKLKLFLTRILKFIAEIVYKVMCFVFPIKANRVVFVTPRHDVLKDNLHYLYKEMAEAKPKLEYVVVTRRTHPGKIMWLTFLGQVFEVYYYLATARIFILDDYYLPLYFIEVRKGTEVVQLWHASGPLKKVGLSLRGSPDGPSESYLRVVPVHRNYDKAIVNSDVEIEIYAEAFGMESEKVLALGSPRTDILFENINNPTRKEEFIKTHPEFKDKELILYAPTFRGRSNGSNPFVPNLDMEKLIPLLVNHNKVILFNLHPYMNENLELINKLDGNSVFWNRDEYMIEELLMISDALISDYSSVIYDFAILEKPIAMYCYDYEQYNAQRGFYLDGKQLLPETYFEGEKELLAWILSDSKNAAEVRRLKQRNFKYQDGQASKRIIESLFK